MAEVQTMSSDASSEGLIKKFGSFYLEYSTKDARKKQFPGKCNYAGSIRKVFIRKYELANDNSVTKETKRDLEVLQKSSGGRLHENFIRFMGGVEDEDFYYAATEFCEYSVEDLFYHNAITDAKTDNKSFKFLTDVRNQMGAKEILRQSTEGVAFLHGLGYLHRNLKPSNFRISCYENAVDQKQKIYQIKITDFRKTKDFQKIQENSGSKGSGGWIAPECIELRFLLSEAVDVFILGNFFYYVLSGGLHPFFHEVMEKTEREKQIEIEGHKVYQDGPDKKILEKGYKKWWARKDDSEEHIQELTSKAVDLIEQMIKFLPQERIESKDIAKSNFFQPSGYYAIYDDIRKPGLLLVFCQTQFLDEEMDVPTLVFDKKRICEVFQKLGFNVEVYREYYAKRIEKTVLDIAQDKEKKLKNYNCLAVCILSHGNSEGIYGSDHEEVAIHKLQYAFNSNDCPALHNKPKIFIIQTCRIPQIPKLDRTNVKGRWGICKKFRYKVSTRELTTANFFYNLEKLQTPFKLSLDNKSPVNDFLCIMATTKGSYAYVNETGTSNFIETLYSNLKKSDGNLDLEDILCQTQREMAKIKTEDRIQTIERITSLRNKIVLKKCNLAVSLDEDSFDFAKSKEFERLRISYAKYRKPNRDSSTVQVCDCDFIYHCMFIFLVIGIFVLIVFIANYFV